MGKKRSRQRLYLDEEGNDEETTTSSRCHNLPIQNSHRDQTPPHDEQTTTNTITQEANTNTPQTQPERTPRPRRTNHSRRAAKRFRSKQAKVRYESSKEQISQETLYYTNDLIGLSASFARRTQQTHNLTPDFNLSPHRNAQNVLGSMTATEYFPKVKNLTFHDLTTGNILPKSSNLLLGLGLKFIPTPKGTTPDDIDKTLSRFERDIG